MQVLTVNGGCYFLIDDNQVKPENLTKDDLLKLFNEIYEIEDIKSVELPTEGELNNIKNPVEKEIVNQIIQKIEEFINNLESIKRDIESSFPSIENEDETFMYGDTASIRLFAPPFAPTNPTIVLTPIYRRLSDEPSGDLLCISALLIVFRLILKQRLYFSFCFFLLLSTNRLSPPS